MMGNAVQQNVYSDFIRAGRKWGLSVVLRIRMEWIIMMVKRLVVPAQLMYQSVMSIPVVQRGMYT